MKMEPKYKIGDKIKLWETSYSQDFSGWSNNFQGKEFIVHDIVNKSYCLVAYGYGILDAFDSKAYGNGKIYVLFEELDGPKQKIAQIKSKMGYGEKI